MALTWPNACSSAAIKVLLMDNLSTGSMENIRHLKKYDRMHYFLEPLENRHLLAELVDEADVILHLAAAVGVKLIVESPVRTIETNVNGTQSVLEAAARKRKLVFTASTSEVYGKNTNVPFHEDADLVLGPTTKGRWSYAASKALDEFLALSYWKEKRLTRGGRAVLQYRGAAADGTLRHGPAEFCGPGPGRRSSHGIWQREAVAMLLRRARLRGRAIATDRHGQGRGRSREYRQ